MQPVGPPKDELIISYDPLLYLIWYAHQRPLDKRRRRRATWQQGERLVGVARQQLEHDFGITRVKT